jgi:anti-sigma regulatory factor (Ser/Thr protein kinase)
LPEPHRDDVGSAFREILLNAVEHGGNLDPSQHVVISYIRARDAVICRIKDPGEGFSLEQLRESAMSDVGMTRCSISSTARRKACAPEGTVYCWRRAW